MTIVWRFLYYMDRCERMRAVFFFLMIRRPPRSTLDRSSAASDVYKRQATVLIVPWMWVVGGSARAAWQADRRGTAFVGVVPVSYTHLRAHETVLDLVCRLLLEKKKNDV